jgi:hypothetical protein
MNTAIFAQRGLGRGRDPWLIRRYLDSLGMNLADVAVLAKTRRMTVSDTVRGISNHRRTLAELERLGCPLELLYPQAAPDGGPEKGRAA